MTKQELEAKIRELNQQCVARVTALQQGDPVLKGLLGKRSTYQEWLEALAADKAPVPATNGKVEELPIEAPQEA